MTSLTRTAIAPLLGLVPCLALLAEVVRWNGGLVRLPFMQAGPGGFPVPLLYWASVAGYAAVYGTLFSLPSKERWARAIRLGFSLHLIALLAATVWYMAHSPRVSQLSLWYVRYWQAVWGAALAAGLAGLWRFARRWRQARALDPWLFYIPLAAAYAGLVAVSWAEAPLFTLLALGGGVVAITAGRMPAISRGLASLGALLSRERLFLAVVFLLALGFRLFYTARILSSPDFLNTGSDGPAYDALAWALVQGVAEPRWGGIALFAPGYVRFLALIYWLAGRNYLVVCTVQSVIGAVTCLLLYDIARRLFGQTASRVAALFGALDFLMVFSAAAIGHQAIDPFWTLLVLWCLLRYLEAPAARGRWMLGIGLLLGWAAVTREGNIVFWWGLVGWLLLGVRALVGWRRAAWHAIALSIGCAAVLAPFALTVRDGAVKFSAEGRLGWQWFVSPNSDANLHVWFNPWADPETAWSRLKTQPLEVGLRLGKGLWGNFNAVFLNQDYGSFDPVFLERRSPYYFGLWGYAYLLGFVGLGLLLGRAVRRPRDALGVWLVLVALGSRSAVHLFFEAAYRHRTPLEPLLILLATSALMHALRFGRRQPAPRGAVAAPPRPAAPAAAPATV